MTTYWRTTMSNGTQSVALYVETYEDAVYLDLTMAEKSLIRSFHVPMPITIDLCGRVLAEAAFANHAKNAGFNFRQDTEEVLAIPNGLPGCAVGGDEDTCAVVVFEYPLGATCAEAEDEGHKPVAD